MAKDEYDDDEVFDDDDEAFDDDEESDDDDLDLDGDLDLDVHDEEEEVGEDADEDDADEEEEEEESLDEELEDDDDEDDEEESLDVLLTRGVEDDLVRLDDERADTLSTTVATISADEFTCRSCFLVKRRAQLADAEQMICLDCA